VARVAFVVAKDGAVAPRIVHYLVVPAGVGEEPAIVRKSMREAAGRIRAREAKAAALAARESHHTLARAVLARTCVVRVEGAWAAEPIVALAAAAA